MICARQRRSSVGAIILAAVSIFAAVAISACGSRSTPPASASRISSPAPSSLPPVFIDTAADAGLRYRWQIPGPRPLNIRQSIGNGCAFLDYDNDGNLDILLVGPRLALYRGDGKGRFTDVTHATGLDEIKGDFLGCAVGDYDNDGYEDVYLTAYNGGVLLHNEGGKRFRDVTEQSGIRPQPWGTSAEFFDADADGKLDLYIGNYVEFGPKTQPRLCNYRGVMAGCAPTDYHALRGVMYHNVGHGRFEDVTTAWKLNRVHGRTLGVAAAPIGSPPRMELALANDETPADLMRLEGGEAIDRAEAAGVAYAGTSVYGGMGIDWGDYNNDGALDLAIATYQNQGKLIFRNRGPDFETQDTARLGMLSSLYYVAFGVKWLDFDNDGWLDLLYANGHVQDNVSQIELVGPLATVGYRQPTVLYHNLQNGTFADLSDRLGGGAGSSIVGRGLAIGDYDNDGRIDALVVDSDGAPLLLHNVMPGVGHWLEVKLIGSKSNRDGIGALVTVKAHGLTLTRLCHTGGSYLSASDKTVHIGFGTALEADVSVRWPSGIVRDYRTMRADQIVTLHE